MWQRIAISARNPAAPRDIGASPRLPHLRLKPAVLGKQSVSGIEITVFVFSESDALQSLVLAEKVAVEASLGEHLCQFRPEIALNRGEWQNSM